MKKIYPVDIFGVKNIGIEEWMNSYYAPVTWKEYQGIYRDVFSFYATALKKYDDEIIYWLAISNIKLALLVSRYIFDLLRLLRMEEAGYDHVVGSAGKTPIHASSNLTELTKYKLIDGSFVHSGRRERIKNALRTVKYNLPLITNVNSIKNLSKPHFLVGSRSGKEVSSYCNANGISPIQIFPILFAQCSARHSVSDQQGSGLQGFVHDFLSMVVEQYPVFRNSNYELLEDDINECFKYSSMYFHNCADLLKKIRRKTLLIEGIGNSSHRLFSSAWRYSGGGVVGFVHGNAYCTSYNTGGIADGTLSVLDKYVVSSRGYAEIVRHASEDFSMGLRVTADIIHNDRNVYRPLFEGLQKREPVREIKKIMLIGFPMNDQIYTWLPGGFALTYLHLELRLIKLLKTAGYYVIYKAHPDRINEVEGIFEGYAGNILKMERFEDVYDMADCLLFTQPHTTTFGFALLTKKPIVLINTKGETWFPRAFELLKRRCGITNAEQDGSGRILFEDQDVINAVKSSLNNINYDILHEFAF